MHKINYTAIIIVALLVVGILVGYSIFNKKGTEKTVTVNGNSQMTVAPDQVVVNLLIQTKNTKADIAKNDNAIISDKVISGLVRIGIDRENIETENYNIYPEYDWNSGTQKLLGYIASNYIKIKTDKFDRVGKIVDVAVDNGGLVNYINFELSTAKSNEYKAKVLAEASKDAKTKAEAIAEGLGRKVGSLVSVSTSDYYYNPYPLYRMDAAEGVNVKTVATDIQPKSLDITASVTVVYEIK